MREDLIERLRREAAAWEDWNEDHPDDAAVTTLPLLREAAAALEAMRAEVERLRADLMESDEIREKLGHLLTRTAAALKGEPPAGVWHSWHDLPEKAAQLAEALRKLEEREQSDEALLRQALEALERGAWDTLSGRNTAFAIRERLGLGQEESHEQ